MITEYIKQPIEFVDVTQRDGEQMEINPVTIEDRIAVFDELVKTGIKIFEIGHLGNSGREGKDEGDQAYARALINHIAEMELVDSRYTDVKLQVLFGSQEAIISEGLEALDGFDKERVIIHVYDRLSESLRNLATIPYTQEQSARRVCAAADIALARGFTHFSVSGEGATDCSVDQAIEYYTHIAQYLDVHGAESINLNLANTFGSPPEGEWDSIGLAYFNMMVKLKTPGVTTSVHVHNDDTSATEFSIAAIRAGFDKVEGTLIGMGERSGNVALCDVIIRLLEIARIQVESSRKPTSIFRLGSLASRNSIFAERYIPESIASDLSYWHAASQKIAEIYGTTRRFEGTSLGDPEAYNAGSGPHDNAALRALMNPAKNPLWRNYLRIALIHSMLGRPEAEGIIEADPVVIKNITVDGRAGGGATSRIINGDFETVDSHTEAIARARKDISNIYAAIAA